MKVIAALLCCVPPLAAQSPLPQPVVLNHLYVVLDSATYHDLTSSPFLSNSFAGFEARTTVSGSDHWTGIYLYGRRIYIEFLGPGGYGGLHPGDVGIGLGVEGVGGIAAIMARFRGQSAPFDTLTRFRDDSSGRLPWFLALRPGGSDTPSEHASFWVMEYTREMALRMGERDSLPPEDRSRKRFVAGKFDETRLLNDLTGATLAVPVEDIAKIGRALDRIGVPVVAEGEGAVLSLDGVRLRLVPAFARPGLRRLEFSLSEEAVANPTYRFGLRSRLRFGPGRSAVWDFTLP